MRVLSLILFFNLFWLCTPAYASCLQEVASFANSICGEIEKSGAKSTVDANGKLDASIGNIVTKVIGASGSLNGSAKVLEESYKGVLQDQLGSELFNVRKCREEMVAVALRQVCASPAGNGGVMVKDELPIYKSNDEFELQVGHSTFLTDEKVLFTFSHHPCGARSDLVCVRLEGKELYLAAGEPTKFPHQGSMCSVTLLEFIGEEGAKFLLRCQD
jgi:hypothetical protein